MATMNLVDNTASLASGRLSDDIEVYKDPEESSIFSEFDELGDLLDDGSKADDFDENILTDKSNRDIPTRKKEIRLAQRKDESIKKPHSRLPTPPRNPNKEYTLKASNAPRLITMEKLGERSYSCVTVVKEKSEEIDKWKDRQLTIPVAPRLSTQGKNGERSYSCVTQAEQKVEEVDTWKDRQLTIPVPPRLATMQKNGEKIYSFSGGSKEDSEILSLQSLSHSRSGERKVTIPETPRLMTMEKLGNRCYSTVADSSPLRGRSADYPSWTEYKDKSIEKGMLRTHTPSPRPLCLTVPAPFALSMPSPKTTQEPEKEPSPKREFIALPLPDFPSEHEKSHTEREKVKTVPQPFHLSAERSSSSCRARSQSPIVRNTFKALPVPNFNVRSMSPSPRTRKPTEQKPFTLHADARYQSREKMRHGDCDQSDQCEAPKMTTYVRRTPPPTKHRISRNTSPSPFKTSKEPEVNKVTSKTETTLRVESNEKHLKGLVTPTKRIVTSKSQSVPRGKTSTPSRLLRLTTPKSKIKTSKASTTSPKRPPQFQAKKMPDFSNPFIPKRNFVLSPPRVKKQHKVRYQFRAKEMPDFSKPFTPLIKSKAQNRNSSEGTKKKPPIPKPVSKIISVKEQRRENAHHLSLPSDNLSGTQISRLNCESNGTKLLQDEDKVLEPQANAHDVVPEETDSEVRQHVSVDVGKQFGSNRIPAVDMKEAKTDCESRILPSNEGRISETTEEQISVKPDTSSRQETNQVETVNQNNSATIQESRIRTANVGDNKEIAENRANVSETTSSQIDHDIDPLVLVMQRLNQSLGKFKKYEEAKALDKANGANLGGNSSSSTNPPAEKTLLKDGIQNHLSTSNTISHSQVKSIREKLDPILDPASIMKRRDTVEDLSMAETPKTSNYNVLNKIDEWCDKKPEANGNVTPASPPDAPSTQLDALFSPSTDGSTFDTDEGSTMDDSCTSSELSIIPIPETPEDFEPTKVEDVSEQPQTLVLYHPNFQGNQHQKQQLQSKQGQIVSRKVKIVDKNYKTSEERGEIELRKKVDNQSMINKDKEVKKSSVGSFFDGQKFIYRLCCASTTRHPSPSATKKFLNASRDDNTFK